MRRLTTAAFCEHARNAALRMAAVRANRPGRIPFALMRAGPVA
ncbi:MAG: hypothetical protein AAF999_14200 [Pseudomonadota bacterium]